MNFLFFQKTGGLIRYILIWIVVALAITAVVLPLFPISIAAALAWSAICSFSLGAVMIFVLAALRYGNFNTHNLLLCMANYLIFTLFALMNWFALSMLLVIILLPVETILILIPSIPAIILIGILLCINIITQYRKRTDNSDENSMEEDISSPKIIPPKNQDTLLQISVKIGQKIEIIPVGDIIYIQSEGDYVMIYTPVKSFLKEQTMKYFEENLPNQFVRVHRSYIVNVKAISRIERYENRGQILILHTGSKIKASRSGYKDLKQILDF